MYLMHLIEHTNDYLCNIILSQGSYGFTDLHMYVLHTMRPFNDATEGSTQEAPMCAS